MNDSLPLNLSVLVWIAAGFFLFFGLSAFRYIRKVLRKRELFRSLAHQMGFGYFMFSSDLKRAGYDLPHPLRPRKAGTGQGRLGLGPGSQNILRGEKNNWVVFFLETPSEGKDGAMETLGLYQNPGANLPYFELVPLRLFDKFHRLLELDIRDIVSGPRMNRMEIKGLGDFKRPRHHLWGETERARDYENLFSKDFLEVLEGHPNWRLQGRGDWVVLYEENIAMPPEDLHEFAGQTMKAMELFFTGLAASRAVAPVQTVEGLGSGAGSGGGNRPVGRLDPEDRAAGGSPREERVSGHLPKVCNASLAFRLQGNKTVGLHWERRIFLPTIAHRIPAPV